MSIRISSTPRYDEPQMLAQIKKAALAYKKIAETTLMFIYRESKFSPYCAYEVFYGSINFMHLLGIKSRTLKALEFYKTCLGDGDRVLKKEDCSPVHDMKTLYNKISVIDMLLDFKNCKCYRIGKKDLVTRDNDFEMAIGNNSGIIGYDPRISIRGSRKVDMSSPCIPTTLLNKPIHDYCSKPNKIVFVLQKSSCDKKYSTIFFEIKKGLFKEIFPSFPEDIKKLIDDRLVSQNTV